MNFIQPRKNDTGSKKLLKEQNKRLKSFQIWSNSNVEPSEHPSYATLDTIESDF
jgi:hypothetical protein